ncbi:MAG: hypothetical protein HONDAALG_03987 [Gammaproteobacteria bacterium]|nr:hypothetical protein [Gammaproteobacteria bacterium]
MGFNARHVDRRHTTSRHHLLPQVLGGALRPGTVPADVTRRDGGARLGLLRHRHRHGRCLCRSPELRDGDRRPRAGGAGIPRRHHRPAGLARRRSVQGAGPAEPVLRHHRRQHGLDGQPLHRRPPHPQRRRVHGGRRGREAAGSVGHRLLAARARGLRRCAHHPRRHRGLAAAHRALRLLVGEGATIRADGRARRSAAVRQCRARDRRGRPSPGREDPDRGDHRRARHGLRARRRAGGLDRDRLHDHRHAGCVESAGRSLCHGGRKTRRKGSE